MHTALATGTNAACGAIGEVVYLLCEADFSAAPAGGAGREATGTTGTRLSGVLLPTPEVFLLPPSFAAPVPTWYPQERLTTTVKFTSILVPVKSLPDDEEVLQLAFTLAGGAERRGKPRPKIEVIHVIEVPQALALDADMPEAVQHGESVLAMAERMAAAREVGIGAEMLQARSAGVAIVDEAIERGADLILMGARYRRRHGEFSLGVTLPYVFKNAPCRVLVARGAKGHDDGK